MIFAFRDDWRILTSCKSPIIKGASSWINNLTHSSNLKFLNTQLFITSSYPLHHLSNRKLNFIVFRMTFTLMLDCSPVETNLIPTVMKNKSDIYWILPKNMINNNCWIGLITICIAVYRIISIWIKLLRKSNSFLPLKTRGIDDWKINNMCSYEMFKTIK